MAKAKRKKTNPAAATAAGVSDAFISGTEAGAMLAGASRRKLRALIERGEFHSYALDGKTVYSRREIADFIARLQAKGPGRAPWRGGSAADGSR
jgi:hypothetical protein